jgi:glycosyltransferase involved in cell wall biosynthesis
MRILISPFHYSLSKAGSEIEWSYRLAEKLAEFPDVEFDIIYGFKTDSFPTTPHPRIHEHALYSRPFAFNTQNSLLFHWRSYRLAKRIIHKQRPHIIHHMLPFAIDRTPNLLALHKNLNDIPLVIGPIQSPLEYPDSQSPFSSLLSSVFYRLLQGVCARTLARASVLIPIDRQMESRLKKKFHKEKEIVRIPAGLSVEEFSFTPHTYDKGPLRLFTAGHIINRKGVDVMIDALALVRERGIEAELTIAGSGPETEALKARAERYNIADVVHFLGICARPKMLDLYRSSHLYISMSRGESWGMVYLEAMACGLPVIASKTIGSETIITHGKSGLLVNRDDAKGLAQAICQLAYNPAQYAELSRQGRIQVEQHFNWSKIVKKYYQVYQSLLKESA